MNGYCASKTYMLQDMKAVDNRFSNTEDKIKMEIHEICYLYDVYPVPSPW